MGGCILSIHSTQGGWSNDPCKGLGHKHPINSLYGHLGCGQTECLAGGDVPAATPCEGRHRKVGSGATAHQPFPEGTQSVPQRSAYVFHKQDEVKRVSGAWLELGYEMNVEVAGFGGFGVYK